MTAWLDSRFAIRAALFAAVCEFSAGVLAQGITDTIALRGDLAPGGDAFVQLAQPKINDLGQVAFSATIGQNFAEEGIYRRQRGAPLVQIARTGQTVGIGGGQLMGTSLNFSDLNNAGQVAFGAHVAGPTHQDPEYQGIFLGSGGGITKVIGTGDPVQGFLLANAMLSDVQTPPFADVPTLNDSGQVAFWGNVDACDLINCTPVNFDAVFLSNTNGTVEPFGRVGMSAPLAGGGSAGTVDEFVGIPPFYSPPTVLTSNAGNVVFRATATSGGEGLFWSNGFSFFTERRAIARNGQTLIPGAPGTIEVAVEGDPPLIRSAMDMNDADEVAFWARVNPLPVIDHAIYRWSPDEAAQPGAHGLTQIARSGQLSPDGNGTIGGIFQANVQLNEQGQVAFIASISDFNDGLFRGDGQTLSLIARQGQPTPDGQRTFDSFSQAAINDDGFLLFRASLRDLNGQLLPPGLYLSDGVQVIEVMRPGLPLAGSIVQSISFDEGAALNSAGQVAYFAILEDGRDGIFLFTTTLPGDFNRDGAVNIADYVVWRKTDGSQVGYDAWRTHFGESLSGAGSGANNTPAVPEPVDIKVLLLTACLLPLRSRRLAA